MINFSIRKVYFNIDELNFFCQSYTKKSPQFFDSSLETLDGKHTLKNPDFQNEGAEIPFNYRAREIKILKDANTGFFYSITICFEQAGKEQGSITWKSSQEISAFQQASVVQIPQENYLIGIKVFKSNSSQKAKLGFILCSRPDFDKIV